MGPADGSFLLRCLGVSAGLQVISKGRDDQGRYMITEESLRWGELGFSLSDAE